MSLDSAKSILLDAGLHEDSVERLIDHYQRTQVNLSMKNYESVGNNVGNFCENAANLVLSSMGEPIRPRITIGKFVKQSVNGQLNTSVPKSLRVFIPNMIRAAYDIRNTRDTVHINLTTAVNHADAQTASEICSWILAELLRIHGDSDDMDELAKMIDEVVTPDIPFLDKRGGPPLIMREGLSIRNESLIHLYFSENQELNAEELVSRIPGSTSKRVKGSLAQMKQKRLVRYFPETGEAILTHKGASLAQGIIDTEFENQ